MSKYVDQARALRAIVEPHYNCAQAVLLPFASEAGLDEQTAYQLAYHFGGGLKIGSVCGAVTGGLMALGLFGIQDDETRNAYYERFRAAHEQMLDCAPLVQHNADLGREKKPFCDDLVYECIGLVEKILRERGKIA